MDNEKFLLNCPEEVAAFVIKKEEVVHAYVSWKVTIGKCGGWLEMQKVLAQ